MNENKNEGMQLMNVSDAAAFLSVKPQTLANFRCQGRGPVYSKFGRRVIYDRKDLESYVATNKINPCLS